MNPESVERIIDLNEFSTEIGYLKPGESNFRNEICLNGRWDFQPVDLPSDFVLDENIPVLPLPQPDQWETTKLKVPSPWNINGFVDDAVLLEVRGERSEQHPLPFTAGAEADIDRHGVQLLRELPGLLHSLRSQHAVLANPRTAPGPAGLSGQ